MKKRNVLSLLLILCLLILTLGACSGPADIELPLGHRYGNPEVTYADGEISIKYICVDCDFTETEIRAVSTQVADAVAWNAAFENLNKSKYSLSMEVTDGEITNTKYCVISDNRGYYASASPEEVDSSGECYTLQKDDESFITYVITEEEGTYLADETDNRYWVQMKKESSIYIALEDKFDQFTYDAGSGSYVSTAPMDVEMFGFEGESLGITTFQSVSVNIADGNICRINAKYSLLDEFLEEIKIDLCFYNIGFSVVKVPQALIDEVSGTNAPKDPIDYFTYEIKNGAATITTVDTAISGNIAIPAAVGECPVVAIGENAFLNCSNLTGITIPSSVVSIGDNAFLGCDGLVNVSYTGTQTDWEKIAISETGNEALLNANVQFNNACAHSYGDGVVTKQPTCGASGVKTYTCTLCGSEKTEIITENLSHSYDDGVITEEPTCSDAGIKIYTCTVCGKNKTEYVPKLETHSYTNGTCTYCGADDPKYVGDSGEEADGIWGAIVNLVKSILEIIDFFK